MNVDVSLVDNTLEMAAKVAQALQTAMSRTGNQVVDNIRANLTDSQPAGKTYNHRQASAPGHAPADPQGNLAASIEVSEGGDEVEVTVGAPYAAYLEFGTRRMAPRPFVLPAAMAAFESVAIEL